MEKKLYMLILHLMLSATAYAESTDIILQRDDIKITMEDVDRYISDRLPENAKQEILNRKNIFEEIVSNIYTIRVLAQAEENKGRYDHAQLDWSMQLERDRRLMRLLLNNAVIEELGNVDWEAAAKEIYLAENEKYNIPEKVHASHILVSTESRTDAQAKTLAEEIRDEVMKDTSKFGEIAKQKSEDPSAARNSGNLGYFARGKMVQVFEETAFAMTKKDDISEVVKSPFGYHIIQYHGRKEPTKQSFEAVKEGMIKSLKQEKENQVEEDILVALRSDPNLKWDPELLKKMADKYQNLDTKIDKLKTVK